MADENAAVLFASLIGGPRLFETSSTRATAAAGRCLDALREATRAAGGLVVKTVGDEIMATFADADAAAAAGTRMHLALDAPLPGAGMRFGLRVGFHAGPVLRRNGDVFGDTVNLAARLAAQAAPGQILTSSETAQRLSSALRNCTRMLYSVEIKGKSASVELCEILWQQSPDITDLAGNAAAPAARLRIRHRGVETEAPEDGLHVGRERGCDVVVDDEHASRRHCTIHHRHGKFVLQDHSANGTYVMVEGEGEVILQREDYVLRGHGWITFGRPRAQSDEALEYFCD